MVQVFLPEVNGKKTDINTEMDLDGADTAKSRC
jgi:hypothetical protein